MRSPRLSKEEVLIVALIYRLALSSEDVDRLIDQLSDILDQFRILDDLPTDQVNPTGHSVSQEGTMRDDLPSPPIPSEEVLANAPLREADYFRVKAVLE